MSEKKWVLFALAVLFISSGGIRAEEKSSWSFSEWLKSVEMKVRGHEQRRERQVVSVAAVRGAEKKKTEKEKLYWKGEQTPATQEELSAFKLALKDAQSSPDAAKAALSDFAERYPNSVLAQDAEEALAQLAEAPQALAEDIAPTPGGSESQKSKQ